jgi:MFS family permease
MKKSNIAILAFGQTVGMSGIFVLVLLGGIIGASLAPSPAWATLPNALLVAGSALFTIPAAALMRRIGRRRGFASAAGVGGMAALLAAYAVAQGSFPLLCMAALFLGANIAFVQQYRFAAAESAEPRLAGRAVSLVLLGGILAAFLGAQLTSLTKSLVPASPYSGPFVGLALLLAAVAVAMLFFRDVAAQQAAVQGPERPLREIAAQPPYAAAVLFASVAFGVMTFVMTATPIHLHSAHGYTLQQTSLVVQSHLIAMFLPSLFTAVLIERLGLTRLLTVGVASLVAAIVMGVFSHALPLYWGALVLLGLGWNFLFVGATVLLTRSYRPAERFKAQAANDFVVLAAQTTAALLAGTALLYAGWQTLNLIGLVFLAPAMAAILVLHRRLALAPSTA